MKEKSLYFWRSIITPIFFYITLKVVDRFYGDQIAFYYEKIPKSFITAALILLLVYVTCRSFIPKKKDTETVFIPSENDYARKDTSLGFAILLIIGFLAYAYIINIYKINYIIILATIFVVLIRGIFLNKTASFQIKEEQITFKSGKEEQIFKASEITSMEIYPNQIHLHKQDSKEVLLFLSLDKIDFQNIKKYFNKRVPEISVTLASPVVN